MSALGQDVVGFFGPGSLVWRVDRELMVLLGSGARALLLQIAHPKIAAAVATHSRFESDPLGRLRHTLEAIYAFAFADQAAAERQIAGVNRRHSVVTGSLSADVGGHAAGASYSAQDPELMLWVYATLIDSSVVAYEALVRRLSTVEADAYYQEMRRGGEAWGIPDEQFPSTLVGLRAWMAEMVTSGQVAAGEDGRRIARTLLRSPAWWIPQVVHGPVTGLSVWLLPAELRAQLGIAWGPRREQAYRAVAAISRAVTPRMPQLMRDVPWARAANRRIAAALRAGSI